MSKTKLILAVFAALALPSLAACGGVEKEDLAYTAPDMFRTPVDPSDAELKHAVDQFLAERKGPPNSQYEYTRADLNNDGLREAVVIFNLPHSYWCGWSGCTMAVFQAGDNSFQMVSETTRIRGPIQIADTATDGWRDIGVRLSGTNNYDKNVLLQYNGAGYPENPMGAAEAPFDLAQLGGTRVLP
ncbi:MAG TPA: hypothetical protein VFS88_00975 [Micavibrio sp.]|nr:hypothetical protein [Micavibrio sp.]